MSAGLILVVEDDPLTRADAATLLAEIGLDVVQMDNADDALAFIFEQASDIGAVFSDIHMPGHMSGLHLAETVARHWPAIPIVLSSGRVRPMDALPDSVIFLPKPWQRSQVLGLVRQAVGRP